jgi:pimeloyl-ACP methyl ester carboxylesterase
MASDETSWRPHHALVAPEGDPPRGWILFLHGILGSGPNWRTIARKLVAARPEWGAVLVDLRMHGRSQDAPPPHDLAAVAADLARLTEHLAGRGMPVAGVIGHSFGGKSALAYRGLAPVGLQETWVLDASPSIRVTEAPRPEGDPGDGAVDVLRALERLPKSFETRDEFLDAMTGRGFSRGLAEWLAMNLVPEDGAYRLRLELAAIDALLVDYCRQDLWPVVESTELPGAVRFVVAGRSSAVSAEDRARLEDLSAAGRVALHLLPDAGHWLHLDAGAALLDLFSAELAAPAA